MNHHEIWEVSIPFLLANLPKRWAVQGDLVSLNSEVRWLGLGAMVSKQISQAMWWFWWIHHGNFSLFLWDYYWTTSESGRFTSIYGGCEVFFPKLRDVWWSLCLRRCLEGSSCLLLQVFRETSRLIGEMRPAENELSWWVDWNGYGSKLLILQIYGFQLNMTIPVGHLVP